MDYEGGGNIHILMETSISSRPADYLLDENMIRKYNQQKSIPANLGAILPVKN
jgi:hypothetical protein